MKDNPLPVVETVRAGGALRVIASEPSAADHDSAAIIERSRKYLVAVYQRADVAFVRGRGAELWDADGRRVLDFFSSILCVNLGHCHPRVTAAIQRQAETLVHVSNLQHSEPQARLAELLVTWSFADRVFLCNSGAEANEAAIKAARRYGHARSGQYEILTALGSFHGRTLGTIAATGQERLRRGFEPLLPGFRYVAYGDLDAAARAITRETVAIMIEPVQGEGGIVVPPRGYLKGLRELCDRAGILLVFDEVQTGCGRTGTLWAYEQLDCVPDVMTLAKSLGNGVPVGAMLCTDAVAEGLDLGAHGSTFGGNCLTNAAAIATIETLTDGTTLPRAREAAARLRSRLEAIATRFPEQVAEVRGLGMLIGVEMREAARAKEIAARLLAQGMLINVTAERVLRIAPPLTVSDAEIDEGTGLIEKVIGS